MVKLMLLLMSGLMNKRTKAEEVLFFHQDQEDSDRNKCTLFVERDLYSALLCTCPAPMRERSSSVSVTQRALRIEPPAMSTDKRGG